MTAPTTNEFAEGALVRARDRDWVVVDASHAMFLLVYRLIFPFVAEDRDLLHPEDTPLEVRRWYANYFSTVRLRRLAHRRRAGRHTDLWRSLRLVFDAVGGDGQPALGLPAYGSHLFDTNSLGPLRQCRGRSDDFHTGRERWQCPEEKRLLLHSRPARRPRPRGGTSGPSDY